MSDDEAFLSRLPIDGNAVGNISLRNELEWSEERYLAVREGLLQEDLVSLGKGRGGSVRLVDGDMRSLSVQLFLEGKRATHKKLMGKLEWEDARYLAALRRLWKGKVIETGPRGTISYTDSQEAEEWLLLLAVPQAVSQAFDRAKVAATLGWSEHKVLEVRARCIEKVRRVEAARTAKTRSAKPAPAAGKQAKSARKPEKVAESNADGRNGKRTPRQKLSAFVAYARVDSKLRERLEVHLAALRRNQKIDDWSDQEILPGEQWSKTIRAKLEQADLVLVLVSADFLHSEYCYSVEMIRALERHAAGSAWVVPIILRPCDWKSTPLVTLQALPANGDAITTWGNEDSAFCNVIDGIRAVVAKLG